MPSRPAPKCRLSMVTLHSRQQSDHPPCGAPGNTCDAFCSGVESREAPNMQRATVPTGWEGARRLLNSIWILFFKGIRDVALPIFEFTSDTYFVLRCSYWKLPDVFLELHRLLALACGIQSFTPLRVFTIISELIYTTLCYYTSECSFHRVQAVKAWKGENKKKSVLRN